MTTLRLASYKNVPFRVESADGEVGRRTVLNELPFRDIPQGEDLGRAARAFTIVALFVGPDSAAAAKDLIDALESPGTGTLVHPFYGTHQVQVQGKAKVRWPQFDGGRTTIEMSLCEASEELALPGEIRPDTDSLLESACDAAQEAVDKLLDSDWLADIEGYLDAAVMAVDTLMATIESFMAPLERAEALLDRMLGKLNHLINSPLALAKKLGARISNIIGKLQNPFSGLSAWKKLMRGQNPWQVPAAVRPGTAFTGDDISQWVKATQRQPANTSQAGQGNTAGFNQIAGTNGRPAWVYAYDGAKDSLPGSGGTATPATAGQAIVSGQPALLARNAAQTGTALPALPPSLTHWARRTLVIEAARTVATVPFASKREALAAKAEILAALQTELQAAPDELIPALQLLRRAVTDSITTRLPRVADIVTVESQATLPALVLAYRVSGHLQGEEDLVARNRVSNPLFVPAGKVEVLHDA